MYEPPQSSVNKVHINIMLAIIFSEKWKEVNVASPNGLAPSIKLPWYSYAVIREDVSSRSRCDGVDVIHNLGGIEVQG